jgi:HAD superfamily hydrolase (TIGR01549 family)
MSENLLGKDLISFLSSKRIAIYGTGNNAKLAGKYLGTQCIICYLDGKKNAGQFNGKEIVPIEKIPELNVEVILVASEPDIEKLIYERISGFCSRNGISVYGMHGRELAKTFSCKLYGYNQAVDREELLREITGHEVISFDVFDTLLMRKTLLPDDVFEIVCDRAKNQGINVPRFKMIRKRAEANVLDVNHTLDSIYDEIHRISDIEAGELEILKQIELEVEEQCIIPRDDMVEIFNYVKSLNKKIYIITDMYLSKDFIGQLLHKNGIDGFADIYVSGEYGLRKNEGLFDVYKKNEGNDLKYLHIGDHALADGIWANVSGIDAYIIPSAYRMLETSRMHEVLHYADNVNERSLIGLMIAKMFNNPFSLMEDGRMEIDEIGQIGYCFAAPFLLGYIVWLVKYCIRLQPDRLLFAARDGFLLKDLFDMACERLWQDKKGRSVYFLTSRMAAIRAGMMDEQDVHHVNEWYGNHILIDFFGTEDTAEILKKSEMYRAGYLKYVESLNMKDNENVVFIDFDSCGTTQYFLSKFLPFKMVGAYAWNYIGLLQAFPPIDSFISASANIKGGIFWESILQSSDATLEGFDKMGAPDYHKSDKEINTAYLKDVQSAIKYYFKDYLSNLYVSDNNIGGRFCMTLFDFCKDDYTNVNRDIFADVWVEGSGFNNDMKVVEHIY